MKLSKETEALARHVAETKGLSVDAVIRRALEREAKPRARPWTSVKRREASRKRFFALISRKIRGEITHDQFTLMLLFPHVRY